MQTETIFLSLSLFFLGATIAFLLSLAIPDVVAATILFSVAIVGIPFLISD